MLDQIATALREFNDDGRTVIKSSAEFDSREIAEYVRQTLDGLKCDYSTMYQIDTGEYIITSDL